MSSNLIGVVTFSIFDHQGGFEFGLDVKRPGQAIPDVRLDLLGTQSRPSTSSPTNSRC